MFRFLPLVLKNSWRNRQRTFLTIASITVSLCLLGVRSHLLSRVDLRVRGTYKTRQHMKPLTEPRP
jgi:cell division protein FtsX